MTARAEFEGHTPGPWQPTLEDNSGRHWAIEALHTEWVTVAELECFYAVDQPTAEVAANARLIAAAPALLAERDALREQVLALATSLADALPYMRNGSCGDQWEVLAIARAEATLAKVAR